MIWWHALGDGTAVPYEDSPEISARVDREPHWYGTIEGAIRYGGVEAVAVSRRLVELFDTAAWLQRGERVSAGHAMISQITADPQDWR